jgi:hypothetical protein
MEQGTRFGLEQAHTAEPVRWEIDNLAPDGRLIRSVVAATDGRPALLVAVLVDAKPALRADTRITRSSGQS